MTCLICRQPVFEDDPYVRTENWIAHIECVFRYRADQGREPEVECDESCQATHSLPDLGGE